MDSVFLKTELTHNNDKSYCEGLSQQETDTDLSQPYGPAGGLLLTFLEKNQTNMR